MSVRERELRWWVTPVAQPDVLQEGPFKTRSECVKAAVLRHSRENIMAAAQALRSETTWMYIATPRWWP